VDRSFTYAVPATWDTSPPAGTRVLVPFGQRALVGVVRDASAESPSEGKVKELHALLDDPTSPSLTVDVRKVCEWIEDYYVAPVGEVYRLALPGLLTNADARYAALTELGERVLLAAHAGPLLAGEVPQPTDHERKLLDALHGAGTRGFPVARLTGLRPRVPGVLRLLSELETRGWCQTHWDEASAQARTELHYRRTEYLRDSAGEEKIREVVGRSKKRRAVLDYLDNRGDDWVPVSELRGPFPRVKQLIGPLLEAELVVAEEKLRQLDPFDVGAVESSQPRTPTEDQRGALKALVADFDSAEFRSTLLHGITGSGKTEVYLQLIDHCRQAGGGAIVLVPEIALTPQLANRFRARFGDQVAVLHSGLTPRQRLDAWQHIRAGRRPIVIGARSAIFAPVPDLRVIVVDEEHDGSFKQEEGVRYNARDVALVRARELKASVVLGSATPSLETYELAKRGKHGWLQLTSRPTPRPLPTVEVVPLAVHRPSSETMLTAKLRDAVLKTAQAGEQVILFLNRRGYTTSLICGECGGFQQCPDCSAPSMTYHLRRNRLVCHLCGHIEAAPTKCRQCGSESLLHGGGGTERIELAIVRELPEVRVLRLDRDTSRGRQLLEVLGRFRAREADVLVGTQMLSKGHDFPGVTLVGILQGDHGLGIPDPRAGERTFQLLTQVAGRAGRGERPGRVMVQAFAVEHPAITHAASHDFEGFAAAELERRREMGNPPFGHLALIRVHGGDAGAVEGRSHRLGEACRGLIRGMASKHADEQAPVQLLGPSPSPIERINRRTRWQLLLRAPARGSLRWLLRALRPTLGSEGSGSSRTLAMVDVDPQTLL
jgi:primosomal protein N' (replication factor Y)